MPNDLQSADQTVQAEGERRTERRQYLLCDVAGPVISVNQGTRKSHPLR